jgi:hypothetical protein
MPGGFAPRFAIEAGFLILLGVGAGLADLRSAVIVALLAGAWVLVSLFELAVWRAQGHPAARAVTPPPRPAEMEPEPGIGWQPEPDEHEREDAYPLRADVGSPRAEEVEAYTRVSGGKARPEDEPPHEHSE